PLSKTLSFIRFVFCCPWPSAAGSFYFRHLNPAPKNLPARISNQIGNKSILVTNAKGIVHPAGHSLNRKSALVKISESLHHGNHFQPAFSPRRKNMTKWENCIHKDIPGQPMKYTFIHSKFGTAYYDIYC
ncbi:MAG: hypothetical protein DSY89_06160, partial [Deltaproteobacteria bacterium]